ncbi:hypothetical protein [Janthinobacterium sp. HH01]|uniref:hypothetical protein n=1 Tax=Janthinobacterium sp. HH01 TaxID=1198452 RepID=UPI0012690887|nr:hypothetical protein [Janthinobacterium sp. HH01]
MSDLFKFPSGRSVGNCRKDAKRLARQEQIPLHAAFDRISNANGMPYPWARALSILDEVKYVNSAPLMYALRVKHLEAGMHHVVQIKAGLFEISRIRGIQVISDESIRIDLGPEGFANQIVTPNQRVNIAMLPCPKCGEETQLSTDLHPGTTYACCLKCGLRGPEFLPRGDEHALLVAVVKGWNNLVR